MRKHLKCIHLIFMLTNLAFVFICERAGSALVQTSAFLQPFVRGQVYIFLRFRHPCTCMTHGSVAGGVSGEVAWRQVGGHS